VEVEVVEMAIVLLHLARMGQVVVVVVLDLTTYIQAELGAVEYLY
jgi:hypothetical protein